ncbi:hypothetical protein Pelo_3812 [Pelomyxa schiedti]|nr:hypothetical protein Pelo_3812 [Pelomyxa schiedti]
MATATMDLSALTARRSCRSYKADPVPRPLLEALLSKAVLAPSAMGKNPWKFYVVSTPELIAQINTQTKKMSYNAPVLIFTTTVNPIIEDYDVALAHENLCIAATAHGVASILLHYNYPINSEPVLRTLLHIPEGEKLNSIGVALGYSAVPVASTPNRPVSAVFL